MQTSSTSTNGVSHAPQVPKLLTGNVGDLRLGGSGQVSLLEGCHTKKFTRTFEMLGRDEPGRR
jgi:hypothetical protein